MKSLIGGTKEYHLKVSTSSVGAHGLVHLAEEVGEICRRTGRGGVPGIAHTTNETHVFKRQWPRAGNTQYLLVQYNANNATWRPHLDVQDAAKCKLTLLHLDARCS